MMNEFWRFLSSLLLTGVVSVVFSPAGWAKADADTQRAEIRQMRDEVLEELFELKPEVESRLKKAEGYAVFTNVGVNVIFASFAGGKGIVVDHGFFTDDEIFMKMGSAGIGLGLGVKDFRAVFVFTDEDVMERFIETGWDFSGQADAAAKSNQKGGSIEASGTVLPGMEVYQLTKNGLALQATVQGTKYWKDKELN
jgi:lipid-binding SYLF domain-containing protein